MPRIRLAHKSDIQGIARVHIDSWVSTYRGIISDHYLSQLNMEKREKSWIWQFDHPHPDEVVFVAENEKGEIIGFANGGRNRSDDERFDGELYAIYVLEEYQGQGVGSELVRAVLSHLRTKRYKSFMVWVLEKNAAIGFYKRIGGRIFSRKDIQIGEETLVEAALGWDRMDDVTFVRGVKT